MNKNIFQSISFINEFSGFSHFTQDELNNVRKNIRLKTQENESIRIFNRNIKRVIVQSNSNSIQGTITKGRTCIAFGFDDEILAYYIANTNTGLYEFKILDSHARYNTDIKNWLIAKFELMLRIKNMIDYEYYLY